MPNWKIHIEIGKRVNKYLNYVKEDLNLFLLGSILPDINNCHVLKDISKKIDYEITHIGDFLSPSHIDFYDKYRNEIDNKNPLFIGYLLHLYTDYNWNKNFRRNVAERGIQREKRDELRIMKQHDFRIYNNKFIKNTIEIRDIDRALSEITKIDEVSIEREDILRVIEFLYNQKEYDEKLKFYTIEELDKLTNDTVTTYIDLIKEL